MERINLAKPIVLRAFRPGGGGAYDVETSVLDGEVRERGDDVVIFKARKAVIYSKDLGYWSHDLHPDGACIVLEITTANIVSFGDLPAS